MGWYQHLKRQWWCQSTSSTPAGFPRNPTATRASKRQAQGLQGSAPCPGSTSWTGLRCRHLHRRQTRLGIARQLYLFDVVGASVVRHRSRACGKCQSTSYKYAKRIKRNGWGFFLEGKKSSNIILHTNQPTQRKDWLLPIVRNLLPQRQDSLSGARWSRRCRQLPSPTNSNPWWRRPSAREGVANLQHCTFWIIRILILWHIIDSTLYSSEKERKSSIYHSTWHHCNCTAPSHIAYGVNKGHVAWRLAHYA